MKYRIIVDKEEKTMTIGVWFSCQSEKQPLWQTKLNLNCEDIVLTCLSNLFGKETFLCEEKSSNCQRITNL